MISGLEWELPFSKICKTERVVFYKKDVMKFYGGRYWWEGLKKYYFIGVNMKAALQEELDFIL